MKQLWVMLATASLAISACATNQTGNITAKVTGDVSNPAKRGSPLDALTSACGAGGETADGHIIKRQPYLQQVTSSSAKLGWTTTDPDDQRVEITLPDGTPVTSAIAGAEAGAVRANGEHQMWAQIDRLQPDTIYCYTVVNGTPLQERTGFRTAPRADSPEPVRFLAFGDSGGNNGDQHALLAQMFDVPFSLMIHTGDLAYDHGTLQQFEDTVFGVYEDLFRSVPFFPVAGNHDYKTAGGAPFRSVFALPGENERWYSFDWGRVHFVAIDTDASYAEQAKWLDRDLAATRLPWKIVYLHKPPFSSGTHGSDLGLRAHLAPVLEKHRVQLVLAGHDHHYERIEPQNGVHYIVTGGGGKGTRGVGKSSFTAFASEVIHYVYGEVGPDELVLHAIDGSGQEFDSVVIRR